MKKIERVGGARWMTAIVRDEAQEPETRNGWRRLSATYHQERSVMRSTRERTSLYG